MPAPLNITRRERRNSRNERPPRRGRASHVGRRNSAQFLSVIPADVSPKNVLCLCLSLAAWRRSFAHRCAEITVGGSTTTSRLPAPPSLLCGQCQILVQRQGRLDKPCRRHCPHTRNCGQSFCAPSGIEPAARLIGFHTSLGFLLGRSAQNRKCKDRAGRCAAAFGSEAKRNGDGRAPSDYFALTLYAYPSPR